MSSQALATPAEEAHVDAIPVTRKDTVETATTSDPGATNEKKDDTLDQNQPSRANVDSDIEPKVQISAGEKDREEHTSRRIKEAQRYNERGNRSRGSFRGGRGSFKNNSRFDPSKQEKSDDPVAIRKQVEFYFSESNLLTDRFLFERVEGHKNTPVSIDVIHSFKRMQRFQPKKAILDALKESSLLEVVDDDIAVRRKEPLPENLTGKSMDEVQKVHENQSMAKSIYAKGFGEEEATTQFDIEAWFSNYGLTNSVRLRRNDDKGFKGSVFVEFDTEEAQQKFLSLDPPAKWRGGDLEIKSKKQYCDAKVDDINNGRIRRRSPNLRFEDRREKRPHHGSSNYSNKRHDYADGDDDRDWRHRRDDEASKSHRGSKPRDQENSGRPDRRHQHSGRDDSDHTEKESQTVDPTHEKVTTPEIPVIDTSKEEENIDISGNSKDVVTPVGTIPTASEGIERKRSREDEEDEEKQRPVKKVDLNGGRE